MRHSRAGDRWGDRRPGHSRHRVLVGAPSAVAGPRLRLPGAFPGCRETPGAPSTYFPLALRERSGVWLTPLDMTKPQVIYWLDQ